AERLAGRFGVAATSRRPTVGYRETTRKGIVQRGRHKKQSGGHGQFGDVVLDIKPLPRGSGFTFKEAISGGVVPRNYIPSVEEGVVDGLKTGPLGFPVVEVAVTLIDGSYHTVDSSDQAFRTAGRIGIVEALPQSHPVLLEPIYTVEIVCPSEATAKINAILSGRRGQILGFDTREGWPGWDTVKAMMPESEIGDLIAERDCTTSSSRDLLLISHIGMRAPKRRKSSMHGMRRRGWELPEHAATPEHLFFDRRALLGAGAVLAAAAVIPAGARAQEDADPTEALYPVKRSDKYVLDRPITDAKVNGSYNNFYEFGSSKLIAKAAQMLKLRPWTIKIDGMVEKERIIGIDDLIRQVTLEERLYRHRCVEAWSMAIAWSGFPFAELVALAKPLASAKYVRMESFRDSTVASGQRQSWLPWPYIEGLT